MPITVPHVLLVDDDLAVLRVLDRVLTLAGARVSVAADAATARAIVSGGEVDGLILDYRLPGIRGDRLLGELARVSPSLRARTLFITGDISSEAEDAITAAGCDYLRKPFPNAELMSYVAELRAELERASCPDAGAITAGRFRETAHLAPPRSPAAVTAA